ncbi:Small mechanosensitive ion channel [Prochlorococcus sp. SS52]|nr:Small mechanosensitive ion channel [Prochlorococcus marinus str. LG]KGG21876.1 Small mechanosensitive ion channel [Prochlorococcus marinus str. SS2]KGG23693.1 Small mechanosensitive ion channel [Prochlorococcus marinus str. SS35]KGG32071.1 Small mechanosensitive ion channel [Prochlorococcus marinus str. SS51]KGG35238.1 Small mechanosensitive ion channel [Prochlorococcus sp. SS52]
MFSKLALRTKSDTDDYILRLIVETIKPLGIAISTFAAWRVLAIKVNIPFVNGTIAGVFKLILLFLIVRLINRVLIRLITSWAQKINDPAVSTMLRSLSPMVRALIWCIGVVFYLNNMGVQMAAIWALLSAGGIGAGLALKEPVQEFFEYITILLDKPFQNGQFIHIDGVWARVERVGVRSTRMRSINGEIIVMSNSSLTNGVISNYAEMESRRLVHKIGVVYNTKYSQMESIPNIIKSIVEETNDAIFDRCHFIEFGESSLDFELVYYIPTNNYLSAMNAQQRINLEIMRVFEREGIEFAFPTQTIHVSK